MKSIFLIMFMCSLPMFGQDTHGSIRKDRHPLPKESEVTKLYVIDILKNEELVNTIAIQILFSQYEDLSIRNIKKTNIRLYEDINVWEVCYVLGFEGNDTIYSKYFIRFNKNTVEVIDKWIEK